MSRNHVFSPDEWYHCYNRGVEKRLTFLESSDYLRYLTLLYTSNSTERYENLTYRRESLTEIISSGKRSGSQLVSVGAYCLMPNHFHLLLKEESSNGIGRFMQKVQTGYTMYFNKKYEHSGPLFAGVFKSRHIEDDRYLQRVLAYVHLNPVDLGLTFQHVKDYPYSSFFDFLNTNTERPQFSILGKEISSLVNQELLFNKLRELSKEYSETFESPEAKPRD